MGNYIDDKFWVEFKWVKVLVVLVGMVDLNNEMLSVNIDYVVVVEEVVINLIVCGYKKIVLVLGLLL